GDQAGDQRAHARARDQDGATPAPRTLSGWWWRCRRRGLRWFSRHGGNLPTGVRWSPSPPVQAAPSTVHVAEDRVAIPEQGHPPLVCRCRSGSSGASPFVKNLLEPLLGLRGVVGGGAV